MATTPPFVSPVIPRRGFNDVMGGVSELTTVDPDGLVDTNQISVGLIEESYRFIRTLTQIAEVGIIAETCSRNREWNENIGGQSVCDNVVQMSLGEYGIIEEDFSGPERNMLLSSEALIEEDCDNHYGENLTSSGIIEEDVDNECTEVPPHFHKEYPDMNERLWTKDYGD